MVVVEWHAATVGAGRAHGVGDSPIERPYSSGVLTVGVGSVGMLVGRRVECERIEHMLEQARVGDGGAPPSAARPALVRPRCCDSPPRAPVTCACCERAAWSWAAEIAFAGALELLRPILGHLADLPEPQRQALAGALALTPAVERVSLRGRRGHAWSLALAAARRPLLLLVDDAQWLDSASLEALLFAARRLTGEPVALVASGAGGVSTALDTSALEVLALEGLDREATASLAADLLGSSPTPEQTEQITAPRAVTRSPCSS